MVSIATLVFSSSSLALLENSVLKDIRTYPIPATAWSPGLAVQHLDVGTNMSVGIGGIRVLPSIWTSPCWRSTLLAFFPLKGSLKNIAGTTGGLVARGGTLAYIDGPFGEAANIAGQQPVLEILQLPLAPHPPTRLRPGCSSTPIRPAAPWLASPTPSCWTARGTCRMRSFSRMSASTSKRSSPPWERRAPGPGTATLPRLALFINSQIDNLYYLSNAVVSVSAILVTVFDIGSYQAVYNQPPTVLNRGGTRS